VEKITRSPAQGSTKEDREEARNKNFGTEWGFSKGEEVGGKGEIISRGALANRARGGVSLRRTSGIPFKKKKAKNPREKPKEHTKCKRP